MATTELELAREGQPLALRHELSIEEVLSRIHKVHQVMEKAMVEITPKGLDLFDAAHVAAEPLAEHLVAVLKPGEAKQLTDLLTRFTSRADDEV